jgi:hypothetical protein
MADLSPIDGISSDGELKLPAFRFRHMDVSHSDTLFPQVLANGWTMEATASREANPSTLNQAVGSD